MFKNPKYSQDELQKLALYIGTICINIPSIWIILNKREHAEELIKKVN